MRMTVDAVMHKAPWKLYQRSGMRRIIARPAGCVTVTGQPEMDIEPFGQSVPAYAYCNSDPSAVAAGGD